MSYQDFLTVSHACAHLFCVDGDTASSAGTCFPLPPGRPAGSTRSEVRASLWGRGRGRLRRTSSRLLGSLPSGPAPFPARLLQGPPLAFANSPLPSLLARLRAPHRSLEPARSTSPPRALSRGPCGRFPAPGQPLARGLRLPLRPFRLTLPPGSHRAGSWQTRRGRLLSILSGETRE